MLFVVVLDNVMNEITMISFGVCQSSQSLFSAVFEVIFTVLLDVVWNEPHQKFLH